MVAKNERIASELRRAIQAGEWAPGDRLPTEQALIQRFRVSSPTVRQALAKLRAEGILESQHGVGTFVRRPYKKVVRRNDRHQQEKSLVHAPEDVRRRNGSAEADTGHETDDFEFSAQYSTIAANDSLASAFGVEVGTLLLRRVYRSNFADERAPLGIGASYVLLDLVGKNPDLLNPDLEPWPGGTMHQLSTIGIEVDRVVEEITARPPSADEAEELDISPGTSVFAIQKSMIDTTGRVVEFSDFVLPGDRHRLIFTTQLERWT